MASSTVSLARYRPAILALTAIAAGFTVFYIHNIFWSSAPSSQTSSHRNTLHRSNARRRNRQSRHTDHSESYSGGEQSGLEHGSASNVQAESGIEPETTRNGQPIGVADLPSEIDALESGETLAVANSEHMWREEAHRDDISDESQSLLNLLYRIAEDQARKDGYVHRGVTCNSCNTTHIRGIRYRCANCVDYDLCEQCEAMQIHPKTHLFYKVRIPAPFLANPRQPQPVWYPGKPSAINQPLPKAVVARFCTETGFQRSEIEALWEQFRCFANSEFVDDPSRYHLAIDRQTFDKCFVPNTSSRPTPPNLICDRLFAFYDTNSDGLIGFDEFLKGLSSLTKQNSQHRRKKIFDGYDINQDGYVDRKDFLRMFRAFYALSKELTKEIVTAMDDDTYNAGAARNIVTSSQPISSAFAGEIPLGERSRIGDGKMLDRNGDRVLRSHDMSTVRESGEDTGDHNDILADLAEAAKFGNIGDEHTIKCGESMLRGESQVWPPPYAIATDVNDALDRSAALEDIENPLEREKIRLTAFQRINNEDERRLVRQRGIRQRWQRQQFYIDEENGAIPPDEPKIEETAETQAPSRRSRSSSKVRFQDDLGMDEDHETRSITSMSSRSIPVGERWGGYEVPEAEKDVGREILYQITQEGLNDLLDPIFKQRENLAIMARRTKSERKYFRPAISEYSTDQIQEQVRESMSRYQRVWRNPIIRPAIGTDLYFDAFEQQFDVSDDRYLDIEFVVDQSTNQAIHWSNSQPHNDWARLSPVEASIFPSIAADFQNLNPETGFSSLIDEQLQTTANFLSPTSFTNPPLDPTLPQNRSNSPSSTPSQNPSHASPTTPRRTPRTSFLSQPSSPSQTSSTSQTPSPRTKAVGDARLNFLIACDQIEAEDEARGGPGRLNFAEFNEVMSGCHGPRLGFIGEWLEMAKF